MEIALNFGQRYYHFVAVTGSKNVLRPDFMDKWKIKELRRETINGDCRLYHYNMISKDPYFRGEVNGDEKPRFKPNSNDILLIDYPELNIAIIGFPFRKLAVDLIGSLEKEYRLMARSEFVKVTMHPLIKENHKHTDIYFEGNQFWLGAVFIDISGNSFLSTVKLAGNKPLDSDIYKVYFKDKLVSDPKIFLKKCTLKSKVDVSTQGEVKRVSSTLHIDKYGNYKVFIQENGKNIFSLHRIFNFLNHLNCLVNTKNNPADHIEKEES